ncbi:arabinose transporter permease [Thalassospira sp. TSL5-1]|nr:arabinose transporter permease [Thalassospira sp. TSL5-1]
MPKTFPTVSPPPVTLSSPGLFALVTGQLLTQLDFSIVNVALERIGASLGTNANGLVLVVACYGLSFAALLGTGGRLGDRYGRKRLFLIGIVGFCIVSMICGLATNLVTMLVGRFLQGVFGAILMPQILATIHATLHGPEHSRAVGIYTAIAGLSVVIGQVVGGWLVSADLFGLGWRLGFFINLPVCAIILVLGVISIPDTRSNVASRTDAWGVLLFALFLLCLLLPVSLGSDWPATRWFIIALPPIGIAFWWIETRQEATGGKPLLPPSLLRRPMVLIGFLAEAAVTFSYAGYIFITAFCLQSALGFSPQQSGDSFIGLGLMFFIGSLASKRLRERLSDHGTFVLGAGLTISGILLTATLIRFFGLSLNFGHIIAVSGLVGLGNAFMLTSAYRIALSHVEKHHAGEASVAVSTVQQGCFAIGTASGGVVYAGLLPSFDHALAFAGAAGWLVCLPIIAAGVVLWKKPRPARQQS